MTAKEFGVLLVLGAIWGASFMFIKVGGEELQPFALVEMRLGLAAITLMLVVSSQRGVFSAMRANWRALTVMGLLNCAVPYTLITWGETHISSGLAAIYNACAPLWAGILGFVWIWAERLPVSRLSGLLLGMAGVVLVVSSNLEGGGDAGWQLAGQGAVLLAALSYAVAGIYARKRLKGVPSLAAATGQLVTGALLLLPLAAFQVPSAIPSWYAIGAVVTLSIAGTAIASLMYYWLIARVGATGALLVTYLLPGFALIWGALFLHEEIRIVALLGLALVLLGIAVTSGRGGELLGRFWSRMRRMPA